MVRTPCRDKNGLKKGTWTLEEDTKLMAYVTKYECWNWRQLPKYAGLSRCGKSCRLRWLNYLRPNIKRGNFSKEEEETIVRLHESLGNRWSVIAAALPGRTDNDIKNHWHTNLKKKPIKKHKLPKLKHTNTATNNVNLSSSLIPHVIESSPVSPNYASSPSDDSMSNISCLMSNNSNPNDDEFALFYEEGNGDDLWSQPFIYDNYDNHLFDELMLPFMDPDLYPLHHVDEQILWSYNLFDH